MDRRIVLPLFGFFTVLVALYVTGALSDVPFADQAVGFLLGLFAVLAMAAGYSFGREFRGDDGDAAE